MSSRAIWRWAGCPRHRGPDILPGFKRVQSISLTSTLFRLRSGCLSLAGLPRLLGHGVAALLGCAAAHGALVNTNESLTTAAGAVPAFTLPSGTNLLNSGNAFTPAAPTRPDVNYGGASWAPLTDGSLGTAGGTSTATTTGNGSSLVIPLNLTVNTHGYDLTQFDAYGAWSDSGRDNLDFSIQYSTVDAPTIFSTLAAVSNHTAAPVNSTHTRLTDDASGILARRVHSVRFTFDGQENSWVFYREFILLGTPSAAAAPSGRVRVMPLGDSITYGMGAGAGQIAGGYRDPLARAYVTQGKSFSLVGSDSTNSTAYLVATDQQYNEGHTGYRIDQIQALINSWQTGARPDVVLLHLGTNDILQNYNLGSGVGNDTSSAIARLGSLISTLYANNSSLKIVLSTLIPIQDIIASGVGKDAYVKNFNGLIASSIMPTFLGQGRNIVLVDNYANFVNPDGSWIGSRYADYAHPNAMGYGTMAATFAAVALPAADGIVFTAAASARNNGEDQTIATNLVRAGQSTLLSVTAPTGNSSATFPVAGLNDGSAAGNSNDTYYSVLGGTTNLPDAVTFELDTSANTAGYDITHVQVISGWTDHSLGAHSFQLYLSANHQEYINYGTYTNAALVNAGYSSNLSNVGHTSGVLARNVTGVRYVFLNPDSSSGAGVVGALQAGSNGGTLIRELQVFGAASVIPPPSPYTFTAESAAGIAGKDAALAVNLLRAGQSTLSSVSAPPCALSGSFSLAGLNDGSAAGTANETYYSVTDFSNGSTPMPVTITFNLNTNIHHFGYDLSSVQAITGWGDHNLGAQRFQLLLARNNGAFEDCGTYTNAATVNGGNSSFLSTVTKASGVIASNVTAVRYIFLNPDMSNTAGSVGASQVVSSGGTVIHELQAFGSPSASSLAFNTWAAAANLAGANALPAADPDLDGCTNLQEFAFATNPSVASSAAITYAAGVVTAHGQAIASNLAIGGGVDYRVVFGRRKDYVAAGLTYMVQFSAGLDIWVNSADTPGVVASDAEIDAVSVPYPLFIPTARGLEKPTVFRVGVSSN